jgi:hypothetical protein
MLHWLRARRLTRYVAGHLPISSIFGYLQVNTCDRGTRRARLSGHE